nr:ribonuclease H-like domain, reverse transcriptase, RNA-dependent DNA polymerase [Tanacetum cinerariifolium]
MLICGNADESGCSSSKRQHVSADHDNQHSTILTNDNVFADDFLPNAGNYSSVCIVSEDNHILESDMRSRSGPLICGNANGSGCSSSRRQHVSADHDNQHSTTLTNDHVFVGNSLPNTGNSSNLHVVSKDNRIHESVASSCLNRKRTRGAMPIGATLDVGSSSSSTSRRLSTGRCNVNTLYLNNNPMHAVDSSGPLSDYVHIGKCEHSCEHYGARFWYKERIKDTRWRTRPAYHRCCKAGRVAIRTYQIYPEYIKFLLRDHHFKENIRAYNQMFSMTSLGARVDDSVNISRGPYVFKISGQLYHWLDGYSKDMKMVRVPGTSSNEDRWLTIKAYYSYMLHDRVNSFNYLSRTGRLFQQYIVTTFCVIEQSIIDYIREHQNDYLSGIYDTITRGDSDGSDYGGKLILPQSFTSNPRYMYAHYLDALAICRVHGSPSYFITSTCKVKWSEIAEYMVHFPIITTADREDIVDRVFEMKIHQFVKYLRDVKPFNNIIAIVYTVKFQKCGLPHCHTLIWVDENSRVQSHEDIDNYICAELLSKKIDPEGKNNRTPFPSQAKFRSKNPLDLVYGDLCGSISPATHSEKKLIFLLVDDCTRFMWAYFLTSKDQTFNTFKEFRQQIEMEMRTKVRMLRIDRGERRNRTMLSTNRSMMKAMKLPLNFWAEAVRHAIYILTGYLLHTRPDLSYLVRLLNRFMQEPKDHHLKAIKQVIRYIKGTKEHGIIYKKDDDCKITGYSDSSYGVNTDQGKGTTGIVFYFGESPITWCTQKQPTIALSSCESEFMATTGAACQGLWLKWLLNEITGWGEERITLKVDNISAIALVRNLIFHGRSKHIDIRYHFIRECIENGHINMKHIGGELQRADILTKALPRLKFVTMRQMLEVQDLGRSND